MILHKKIIFNGETVFDITSDTVQPDKVLKNETFHNADGVPQTGSIETYTGDTEVTENQTLQTAGKYMTEDITVNVDVPVVSSLPEATDDSPNVVIMGERLYLKTE